ncbi:MAG: GNAT family N-acetyltransferase [Actinomycetia bacterium]|nr:GNAT family N-acetyltransferase [Actinomycetes bacterium]
MTLIIRDYRDGDAEAVVALLYANAPYRVMTPRGLHAQVVGSPARQHYRLLVAEDGHGRIGGFVRAAVFADTKDPGLSFASLVVAPGDRGAGVGSALLAAAEDHLAAVGAHTLYTWAFDEPAAHGFAARHGYRRGRSASYLRLDLAPGGPLPDRADLPSGVQLLPAAHFADDLPRLHEADQECFVGEPGDVTPDAISYQDWRTTIWDRPDFDQQLSTVAVVDGDIAGLMLVETDDRGRYWSSGTAVHPAHRGRGLARAAKAHSLRLARDRGLHEAYTSNDGGNAPMLAVNRWLGYEPCATEWRYIRDLTDRA